MVETTAQKETYTRLLEAGTTLFAQHGFDGTSVRMIADLASANVAAVAYHFGSKRGLYDAVFEHLYTRVQAETLQLPERPEDMSEQEAVRVLVEQAWRFIESHRDAVKMTVREVVNQGQLYDGMGWGWMEGKLAEQSEGIAAFLGLDVLHVRLSIISFSYVLSRYALNHPEELMRLTLTDNHDAAREAILGHLTCVAHRLLLVD